MLTVVSVAAVTCFLFYFLRKHQAGLPPGPKPHPILGNLLDFPSYKPWLKFNEWKAQYGDIIHLKILGQHFVVLNSLKACTDLLEKRSALYSCRPRAIMLTELEGWAYSFPTMKYSSRWRTHRKLFHQYFSEKASEAYIGSQQTWAHAFLQMLLQDPDHFRDHIRLSFACVMLDVTYGIKVKDRHDTYVKTAEVAMEGMAAAATPGSFLVETIPILKYVPAWFPGANFQRKAAIWRDAVQRLRTTTADHVFNTMMDGRSSNSILASMFSNSDEVSDTKYDDIEESFDDMAKSVAATVYAAASDTTIAATEALFLALAKHPSAQKAAQEELDRVTGGDRLPTYEDLPLLPYITAVVYETFRWHTVAPLGLPHVLTADDEYNGYSLPKGTIVLGNIWSILHDPEVYPNPHVFDPSRWLESIANSRHSDVPNVDPTSIPYGFGRRICPGRYFANQSMFITAATVLACFKISPPLDSEGNPQDLDVGTKNGTISFYEPFRLKITPRSKRAIELIGETELCT